MSDIRQKMEMMKLDASANRKEIEAIKSVAGAKVEYL